MPGKVALGIFVGLLFGSLVGLPAYGCPADTRLIPGTFPAVPTKPFLPVRPLAKVVDGPPEEVGRWMPPSEWPVVGIHAALLPNGQVLAYARPETPSSGSGAALWSPVDGSFTEVDLGRDVFCSGHALLPDGRLLVTGGNDGTDCPFQGIADVHLFDPVLGTWSRATDMAVERWYPTDLPLGDGRVLILSGLDRDCRLTPLMERYTVGVGTEIVAGGARPLELYPRLHLLTTGEVAHVGIEAGTSIFDPQAEAWRTVAATHGGRRWAGSSVQLPGEPDSVMIFGGGPPAVATVERIDFTAPEPAWQRVASMHFPRMHAVPVLLPDGTILVVGGGEGNLYDEPVLRAELYDPVADAWRLLPAQLYARMYHSTAILLPDGRVLSAGQDHGPGAYTAELYHPSYLYRGPRPVIAASPSAVALGETFEVMATVDTQRSVGAVVLMTLGSVTHGINQTQRSIHLEFQQDGDRFQVEMPASPYRAPLGFHMLFVVDDDGVPSEAAMVRVTDTTMRVADTKRRRSVR